MCEGKKTTIGVGPQQPSILFLRQSLSMTWSTSNRPDYPAISRDLPCSTTAASSIASPTPYLTFNVWVLEDQTQVLVLMKQALYQLNHPHSPASMSRLRDKRIQSSAEDGKIAWARFGYRKWILHLVN